MAGNLVLLMKTKKKSNISEIRLERIVREKLPDLNTILSFSIIVMSIYYNIIIAGES